MSTPSDPRDPRPLHHDVEVEVTVRIHDRSEEHRFSFVERRSRGGTGYTYKRHTAECVDTAAAVAARRAVDFVRRAYPSQS